MVHSCLKKEKKKRTEGAKLSKKTEWARMTQLNYKVLLLKIRHPKPNHKKRTKKQQAINPPKTQIVQSMLLNRNTFETYKCSCNFLYFGLSPSQKGESIQ